MQETKVCTVCKEEKKLERFYNSKSSKDGKAYRCKTCDDKARRSYEEANATSVRIKRRNSQIKFKYGMTAEQYDRLHEEQGGKCKICGEEGFRMEAKTQHKLVLDHCHKTGKIRGFLCHNCNRALGLFKDNIESLRKAIKYLK